MESLLTLALVSAYNSKRSVIPVTSDSIVSKLFEYCALRGIFIPISFRKLEPLILWTRYIGDQDQVSFLSSASAHFEFTAQDFTRRICELCELMGIVLTDAEIDTEHQKYLLLSFLGNLIPQLKYAVNLAFSKFLKADLPEGSSLTHMGLRIFPRRLLVHIKMCSSPRGLRKQSNWVELNTLFQGFKKGLLPSEPHIVEASLQKHRKALMRDPTASEQILDKLDRFVPQIVEKWNYGSPSESLGQSTHSTSILSFEDGGNVGYARDKLYGSPKIVFEEGIYESRRSIHSYICEPQLIGFVAEKYRFTCPVPVYSRTFLPIQKLVNQFPDEVFEFRDVCLDNHPSRLEAIPACILEPMKVRLITKPGLGLHVRMHKLQRSLRKFLYGSLPDIFKLTGGTLTREDLWSIVGDGMEYDEFICSGDYSAATDNLLGDVTARIYKNACADRVGLKDPRLYENAKNSLQGVQILQTRTMTPTYKDPGGGKSILNNYEYQLEDFRQTNGQLMGHVLSFPILCIANYCAFWDSCERALGFELTFAQMRRFFPVLINGDDILFKTKRCHYEIWMKTIKEYGFDPSVGKNYFSDKFLQINSELWKIDTFLSDRKTKTLRTITKIPYVNMGIITNRKKQDCSVDTTVYYGHRAETALMETVQGRLLCFPELSDKLLDGLTGDIRSRALSAFKKHTEHVLGFHGIGRDWFFELIDSPCFRSLWKGCFEKNLDVSNQHRVACGDLSTYLERTEPVVNMGRLQGLVRRIRRDPCALVADYFSRLEKPEVKWIQV